eukprot:TRINITY_DN3441_c0_g1_i1.p2 TRINITY_DN3441_c0_g1~~TRINITY_DN3441_c0_g1_i1.p2  ORF type:complete len:267 (-),score=59.25 TRINITY_DN3441_c0_g1_i1:1302-2102(-)
MKRRREEKNGCMEMKWRCSGIVLCGVIFFLCFSFAFGHTADRRWDRFHTSAYNWEDLSDLYEDQVIIEDDAIKRISSKLSLQEQFQIAGDMATYKNMTQTHAVVVPIHVNLIFLGFQSDGNKGIDLNSENISPWFEHLDHVLPHVTVPVGEEQTTTNRFVSPTHPIKYRLHIKIIQLDTLVNTVIEDMIYWHLRKNTNFPPMSPNPEATSKGPPDMYYVDAYKISGVLNHLIETLKLGDGKKEGKGIGGYTLFVMNPKKPFEIAID